MSKDNLKKSITLVQAISLVVGIIIGSGIFLKPGAVFSNAGSAKLGLLAWLIGGLVTLASALTIAEIGAAIPRTGGLSVYLEELYGPIWGFLLGWVQSVISYPATVAAQGIAFATFASWFVTMTNTQLKLCAIAVVVFLVLMNIISTKFGGVIQTLATIAKLIPIFAIIIFGVVKGTVGNVNIITATMEQGLGFGAAIVSTLWAYDGWIGVTNIAGELKNPQKDLPRAIIIGISAVIIVYVTFNFMLVNILGLEGMATSTQAAADSAIKLFGGAAGGFIIGGMMISVFGALNGNVMAGSRVPFSLAQRGMLPFAKTLSTPSKSGTPSTAILVQFVLSILYILTGSFNSLTDLIVFVLWIFFTMGVFSIFILRKKFSDEQRPYKTPLYPFVPIIGVCGGIFILANNLMTNYINALIGVVITLIGLPVYYYSVKKNAKAE